MRSAWIVPAVLAATAVAATAQSRGPSPDVPVLTLPPVRVVAPTRLPGDPLPESSLPAAVDVVPGEALRGTGATTLQRALERPA